MKQFLGTLLAVFVALKLTGVIQWSWIWVFSPVWGGLLVIFVLNLFLDAFLDTPRI